MRYIGACELVASVARMLIVAVVAAACVGALLGSILSVVAWRVPRAIPLRLTGRIDHERVACLWSDVPILGRRRGGGSCPDLGIALRPPAFELLTGSLWALLTWRFGVTWLLPAYLALAAAGVLLSVVDLQHQRLPNLIVAPVAVVSLLLLTLATLGSGAWEPLGRAVIGAAVLFVLYLVLALISPASLGMGDVKLAGVLGLLMAYLSWRTLLYGATGAFVISALIGIAVLITRRGNRRTQLPFGPSMMLAALIAIILYGT
jgi:leader peptidase (prepilin peptidase)/N-methyltransferase